MQSSLRTREFYRNGNPTVIQSVPISLSPQDHVIVYCCVYEKKLYLRTTRTHFGNRKHAYGGDATHSKNSFVTVSKSK